MRLIQIAARRMGYEITKSRNAYLRDLFNKQSFDLLIDVGANKGQFCCLARKAGYSGPIIAFEPISEHRPAIESAGNVKVFSSAVGAAKGSIALNVYSSTDFSSFF